MAVCQDCKQDMLNGESCTYTQISNGTQTFKRIRYGDEADDWGADKQPCHDCAVKKGGYHHFGCDVERCPNCGNQLISCDCGMQDLKK